VKRLAFLVASVWAAGCALAQAPTDTEDEEFAARGFVGSLSDPVIRDANGTPVWTLGAYDWVKGDPPETVNPSLWRHARLLARHGLYRVHERIYQVRGFDISNLTVILGDSGFIVLDPLTSAEAARAAMRLVREHLGDRPVVAVIYSHSHRDHYAGVGGVVDRNESGVRIIAPEGFIEHVVSEALVAGPAMARRSIYQFGIGLMPGPDGALTAGIGPGFAGGTRTLIAPTEYITRTRQQLAIDGVRLEFQLTPDTEAPAEMNAFLPDFRALWIPENAVATLHNLLTPRGALVRDAKRWADYLTETIAWYASSSDLYFASHGWPRFGRERVGDFLSSHRDAYKYLHDQSVRLMNLGYTGEEIAERIALPPSLANRWFNRGYYGTMVHNSRAVYQRYMGWYDGNPANLHPLPEEKAAPRYVAAMGGARRVLATARVAFDRGEYRWAAELLNHLVFAEPDNEQAREWLARAHERMAWESESAIWRNMYLSAAAELRGRAPRPGFGGLGPEVVAELPSSMLFDLLSVRLNPATAVDQSLLVTFPERRETFAVEIRNSVLIHRPGLAGPGGETHLSMPRAVFLAAVLTPGAPEPAPAEVEGNAEAFARFRASFDLPDPGFAIVTPR
jgi:alkyl sulfatase BDS1-like metallo-beta-lactamase superfamily hydrolase